MFSTITSPVFSKLVIVLDGDLRAHLPPGILLCEGLRELNRVRPFKLVFLFEGPDSGGNARHALASSIPSHTGIGDLDFLYSRPTVRVPRHRYSKWGLLDDD